MQVTDLFLSLPARLLEGAADVYTKYLSCVTVVVVRG